MAGEPADIGTAGHEVFASIVRGEEVDPGEVAMAHGVKASEQSFLRWAMWKLWNESPGDGLPALKDLFPNPIVEDGESWIETVATHGADIELNGTPDVVSLVETPEGVQIRNVDWKTGRLDKSAREQQMTYAVLIGKNLEAFGRKVHSAWLVTARVRDVVYDPSEVIPWTVLENWWERQKRHLASGKYSPGDHCSMCNRYFECEAAAVVLEQGLRLAGQVDSFMARLPTDPDLRGPILADAVNKARWVEREAKRFLEMAKADVIAHDHAMDEMIFVKVEDRREIVTERALPVLREHLDEAAINAASKISGEKIKDALGHVAPPRGKGKLIKAVWDRLQDAGALESKQVLSLKVVNRDDSNDAERIEGGTNRSEADCIGREAGDLQTVLS